MTKAFQFATFLVVALALLTGPVHAQTILTPTTLASAMPDSKGQTMVLTSATNAITGNVAYVDRELAPITNGNGVATTIKVSRVNAGAPHVSGALVFVGAPNQFFTSDPQGSCTRANESVLPHINTKTGVISDCLGGRWIQGVRTPAPKWRINSPEPGAIAYTSLNTTGTTLGATTLYCTEVNLRTDKLLTGIAILNGTTVGTDNHYVVLYDSAGKALANSAVAGAVAAGASVFQEYAFTTPFYSVGPAQYFACFQSNGTTATVRMAVTGINDVVLTKGQTGATFGTIPALTVPTTFTTAVGPYVYLY